MKAKAKAKAKKKAPAPKKRAKTARALRSKDRGRDAFMVAFGKRIRELRMREGLSQDQLGFEANLTRLTVNRIENAQYATDITSLYFLAKALNVSEAELVTFTES